MDAVVIGSGLIGLAVARELAQRGAAVTVIEAKEPVRAASWAAAGMLAPNTEAVDDPALLSLCTRSLHLYPAFAAALRDETGVDIDLILDGITLAAFDDGAWDELRLRAQRLQAGGVAHRLLDAAAMRRKEPSLAPGVTGGLTIEGEGQVDNRSLGTALHAACRSAGVRVLDRVGDATIETDSRRVRGVRTSLGFVTAPIIVNAAGAWAGVLPGLPPAARPPVVPVKGQMISLALEPRFLHGVTWVPGAYLVPRRDGRLLVGASVEHAGFDTSLTQAAIDALLQAAIAAVPGLADRAIAQTWAGLRPGTPDGLPFIGPSLLEGLYDASGHARNGVLLTPVTALAVADLIEGRDVPPDVAAASPRRVASAIPA
jgi:glycine oxidase